MNGFLYDNGLRHERVKGYFSKSGYICQNFVFSHINGRNP